MQHYDLFAHVYENGTEKLHGGHRLEAIDLLRLRDGDSVLDVPTGTGANLPIVVPLVGVDGRVCGVDASPGMLRRAQQKVDDAGWRNVRLVEGDARELDAEMVGHDAFDAAICMLGLSVIPDWEDVFQAMFDLVRPGGRVAVMDLYLDGRPTSGIANVYYRLLAQADQRRRFWEPLESQVDDVEFVDHKWFGGIARIAAGTKPTEIDLTERRVAEAPREATSEGAGDPAGGGHTVR